MYVITKLVAESIRKRREEAGEERVYRYGLFRDTTRNGSVVHYIKAISEIRREGQLVDEDVAVSPGLGSTSQVAVKVFEMIAETVEPLSPIHLADVVRDMGVAAGSFAYSDSAAVAGAGDTVP